MSKKNKNALIRIGISFVLFIAVFTAGRIVDLAGVFGGRAGWLFPFALYLAIYIIIGYDVLFRAVRNIIHGQVFDENFLMCVATVGAFALAIFRAASGKPAEGFDEACAVLLFYQTGELFQRLATDRSRKSISGLMDIRPDRANVIRGGAAEVVDPAEVEIGEIIEVNPGEKIPLDGVVVCGATTLDTSALTGESLPKSVSEGDEVLSGTVNVGSEIRVRVEKEFYDSAVSKILELVETASDNKSRAENFITKFARYYTPIVVFTALVLAVIPSIITGAWSEWIYRALSFLVVSCPCALVISVPLSFFAGIGAASRYGILVKGSNYLEKLEKADTFIFDKTGTLTRGSFTVVKITPAERADEILAAAAIAEKHSNHPIAKSLIACYGKPPEDGYTLTNVSGMGVTAKLGSDEILCGNAELMRKNGIEYILEEEHGTVVYVARGGKYLGSVLIADKIKDDARTALKELKASGARTIMLTGDNAATAEHVASELELSEYRAELLPQDKVSEVEKILAERGKNAVCFVGDGINDAPVLMRSDVGIAMGAIGSDAAIEAADVVLMHDDLTALPLAKRIAKKTMTVVRENIIFSIAVKAAILALSAFGLTNMWFAVFGDVGVAIIAILNAVRVNSSYQSRAKNA